MPMVFAECERSHILSIVYVHRVAIAEKPRGFSEETGARKVYKQLVVGSGYPGSDRLVGVDKADVSSHRAGAPTGDHNNGQQ